MDDGLRHAQVVEEEQGLHVWVEWLGGEEMVAGLMDEVCAQNYILWTYLKRQQLEGNSCMPFVRVILWVPTPASSTAKAITVKWCVRPIGQW